jgi:hypothetical protein
MTDIADLKEWKKGKLEAIRTHHLSLIKDLGISPFDFNMKKAFYDSKGVQVVGIFASEFLKEKGFFFELISSDLDPIDPQRRVYRVPYCSSFEDEYELNAKNSYNVPLEELRVVNPQSVAISKISAVSSSDKVLAKEPVPQKPTPTEDAPYSEMTIRDYMAIHTGKPVSSKNWLNDLIKLSK